MSRGHVQTRVSEQIRALFRAGSLGGVTAAQLLERYLSPEGPGAETAFAALVERHGPMVMGVCRRLLLDAHLAEDAFHATILRTAWESSRSSRWRSGRGPQSSLSEIGRGKVRVHGASAVCWRKLFSLSRSR
jgi:hypothetical protein